MITPLHDKVLIRPIIPAVSAVIVTTEDHYEPEQMGEVIALGSGIEDRKAAVHRVLDAATGRLESAFAPCEIRDRLRAFLEDLRDSYQPVHDCRVGDVVCFSPKHGQELVVEGESLLILREDDLLAVVHPLDA